MKKIVLAATLTVSWMMLASASAQEMPEKQLDFAARLRAKGYADLAMEYLLKLQKPLAATHGPELSLELARTKLALAKDKEADQRAGLYAAAQAEFEDFVKKFPKRPEAAQARLEIARLVALQGQSILNKALRQDDTKSKQEQAKRAEQYFIRAAEELTKAAKEIAKLATDPKFDKAVQEKLAHDAVKAQLDRAIALMDQARTYIDLSKDEINRQRAKIIQTALDQFKSVAGEEKGAISIMAAAWLVKCYQEIQDPTEAKKFLRRVLEQTGQEAVPAHRWAEYFYIQGIPKDPTEKGDKLKRIIDVSTAWLKAYPNHHNTPEGQGVRFELASAYHAEAEQYVNKDPKKDPKNPLALKFYALAQKYYGPLAESDSDFAEDASQRYMAISFKRMGGDQTPIAALKNFEECYLRAQFEISKLREENAKAPDKDKTKKRLDDIVQALTRALQLSENDAPRSKVDDARYFLMSAYFMKGDMYRAAVLGEALGQTRPPTRRSPAGVGYAIQAYAAIFNADPSDSNRGRLVRLAEYVLSPDNQTLWKTDPVSGVARYHLAMLYNRENNFKASLDQLEKLPEDFAGATYALGQAVFIALQAKEKAQDPKEKQFYHGLAEKLIARLDKLPLDSDPSSATMYFHAKLEQPKFYYAEGMQALQANDFKKALTKFQDMDAFTKRVQEEFSKAPVKLAGETQDKITLALGVLGKYARLGLADAEYRAGNYDKVLGKDLAGQIVDDITKASKGNQPIRLKDYQVTGEILGLALRANVQKGKIKEAQGILKLLENLTGEEGTLVDSSAMLRALVQELQFQVRELKKGGEKTKLKITIANFSVFVDELAKQFEKKGLDVGDIAFLGNFYASLDQQAKAAELYKKLPPPKSLDNAKLTEAEEKEVQTYWYLQVQYAHALRLSKNELKSEDEVKARLLEAKKVLDRLMNHKNSRGTMLAEKEQIHILEDSGIYGTAITRWAQFMNNPSLKNKLADDAKLKEIYFEVYYHHAYCWYKYSQEDKVKAAGKEKTFLRRAADYIVRLETSANPEGWQIAGHLFRDLLEGEPILKQEYEEAKKGAK